jgi:hypothetical protein
MTRYFTIHKSSIPTQAIRCKAETAIQAAKLIAKKLFTHTNKSKISMSLRETTRDSKKRIYNYIGTNYNNQIKVVSHRKSKGGNEENIEGKTFILQDPNGRFLRSLNVLKNNKYYEYTDYEGDATLLVARYTGRQTELNQYLYQLHVYPYEENKFNLLLYEYDVLTSSGNSLNIRASEYVCDYDRGYFHPFYVRYGITDDVKLKIIWKDPI